MAENNKKVSYEDLEKLNGYLAKQVDELGKALKQNQFQELVVRLNFCFKVLELAKHFDKEYVKQCSDEIKRILVMEDPNATEDTVPEIPVETVTDSKSDNA